MDDLERRIDAVVDGGPTTIGLESTIIACLSAKPILLRAGGIAREAIERVVGKLGRREGNEENFARPRPHAR